MIPKIIHMTWFGPKPLPQEHLTFIEKCKSVNSNFECKFWGNEAVSDLMGDSPFARRAYDEKEFCFLNDYLRLVILYRYGGVYVDTDIEFFKPLDNFLDCNLFMGFIFDSSVGTALTGVVPGSPIIKDWLEFLDQSASMENPYVVSNNWVTNYFLDNVTGFRLTGARQSLPGGIEIYPKDYFERFQVDKASGGGVSEHHCAGSWDKNPRGGGLKKLLKAILGRALASRLGHALALKKTPYYSVYLQHKSEDSK